MSSETFDSCRESHVDRSFVPGVVPSFKTVVGFTRSLTKRGSWRSFLVSDGAEPKSDYSGHSLKTGYRGILLFNDYSNTVVIIFLIM